MHLMYVDESGDPGLLPGSKTLEFILSGLVVHESRWLEIGQRVYDFRCRVKHDFGFHPREEIHAAAFFGRNTRELTQRIPRHNLLAIYRRFLKEIATLPDLRIVNVVVDKRHKPPGYDIFFNAWRALLQRFENTLRCRNFPGNRIGADAVVPEDFGLIIHDNTDGKKLRTLLRGLRIRNRIASRSGAAIDLPLVKIVEDPIPRDSSDSHFVQAVDVCAYALKQARSPSRYMKKTGGTRYFNFLHPVLCREASRARQDGIVVL